MTFNFNPEDSINVKDQALDKLKEAVQQDLSQSMWDEMKEKALQPIEKGKQVVADVLEFDTASLYGGASDGNGGSVGGEVNRMLDALGLPDQLGDLVGAHVDAQRGDIKGMTRNLSDFDASTKEQLMQMFDQAATRVIG